ncbi:MAG: hypothetical protein ACTHMK_05505 [Dyella sp.]|uniref:hypothetical protein n=1 Tax=Dyella sp. TaxID=1869338 RepID=UPI003F7E9E9D
MVKRTPPTVGIGFLILLVAGGMSLLVHLHPEKLKAPAWVAYLALGLLAFAGVCIVALALRLNQLTRWLVCVLLGAMAIVPAWIALGPGPRQCTMFSLGARAAVSEVACRGAFGIGATILATMFILAVRGALRSRDAG